MKFLEFTEKDYKIHDRKHLDQYLVKLCRLIFEGKQSDPNQYGMVAACILDPDHNVVYGINSAAGDKTRRHAERVAMDRYFEQYGEIPEGSIIITTLSPCNEDDTKMADERYGESCTDLINSSLVRKVYCGYTDPSQDNEHNKYTLEETSDNRIKDICKKYADTFLKNNPMEEDSGVTQEGIEKLPSAEYTGGKSSLYVSAQSKYNTKKLPGGSGFLYSVSPGQYGTNIGIWDPKGQDYINSTIQPVKKQGEPDWKYQQRVENWNYAVKKAATTPGQLIGKLSIAPVKWFPITNSVGVDTMTVDEDYRGQGIAKALYGIVLTILKRTLVAGDTQTPGGRRNWVSLAGIPGVNMKGYVSFEDYELATNNQGWTLNKNSEKNIDTIMGQLGGDYIGKGRDAQEFFAFDVKPTTTGKELEARVKTSVSKIYGDTKYNSGLYATWGGDKDVEEAANLAQQAAIAISKKEKQSNENFADGKNPGRKGLAKRSGVNTTASVSSLRNTAKHSSGEKQRMAHWLANMKAGRNKKK